MIIEGTMEMINAYDQIKEDFEKELKLLVEEYSNEEYTATAMFDITYDLCKTMLDSIHIMEQFMYGEILTFKDTTIKDYVVFKKEFIAGLSNSPL